MTEGRFHKMITNYGLYDYVKYLVVGPLDTSVIEGFFGSVKQIADVDISNIKKYAKTFSDDLYGLENIDYDVVIIMTNGTLEYEFQISARVVEKINCKRIIVLNTGYNDIYALNDYKKTNAIDIAYNIGVCEQSTYLIADYHCYLKPDGMLLVNPFPQEAETAYEVFDNNYIHMYYPEGFRDLEGTFEHALEYYEDFLDDLKKMKKPKNILKRSMV